MNKLQNRTTSFSISRTEQALSQPLFLNAISQHGSPYRLGDSCVLTCFYMFLHASAWTLWFKSYLLVLLVNVILFVFCMNINTDKNMNDVDRYFMTRVDGYFVVSVNNLWWLLIFGNKCLWQMLYVISETYQIWILGVH